MKLSDFARFVSYLAAPIILMEIADRDINAVAFVVASAFATTETLATIIYRQKEQA